MSGAVAVRVFGEAERAVTEHVAGLVDEQFASRLFRRDATLWGPDAEEEASKRLAWVGLAESSRPLLSVIQPVRDACREAGLDRVVLCGMGGSSLAPEVICGTDDVELVVLDSSHPDQVRTALGGSRADLEHTVVVVSSKSGGTVETDSQRRAFEHAFREAGLDPVDHVVVVTDPGSPLQQQSVESGLRVIAADPDVGGRYSALTAFGLVPSALAGADVARLLDDAAAATELLSRDDAANPGLVLGAAMAGSLANGPDGRRDKLVLVDQGSGIVGFPAWAEQLIAESTGKNGTGVLPVVVGGPQDPEVRWPAADLTVAHLVPDAADASPPEGGAQVAVSGALGGQLLLWEVATAVAGRLLGINPFDQPDVESAKAAARTLLEDPPEATEDAGSAAVTVTGLGGDWLEEGASLPDAVTALLDQLDPERGYLAVMAYLDRWEHADLEQVRAPLARRAERPVTFGWGPRFLHSTGQFHKGGPATGVYLQVTDTPREDLAVPDRDFGFGTLIAAQAAGDARVLAEHGRPVLRVHLADRDAGLAALREALEGAGDPA
jgi:glucose-6-phosphate isomerase